MKKGSSDQFQEGDVVVFLGDDISDSLQPGAVGTVYYLDSNDDAHVRWHEHGMGVVRVSAIRKFTSGP